MCIINILYTYLVAVFILSNRKRLGLEGSILGYMIQVDRFDNMTNLALNKAITLANELKCSEVNCSHMLSIILGDENISEQFKNDTGIQTKDFRDTLVMQCTRGYYGELESEKKLSIEDCSDAFDKALRTMISDGVKSNSLVNQSRVYNAIMREKESEVYETLDALSVTYDEVNSNRSTNVSPIDNMPIISKYGVDMVKLAKEGSFDPIGCRDKEIDEVIEILGRRQKSNPCLIGEPGVGKTSIIEGLSQRIADGKVPNYLKSTHIISMDLSGIVSGARFRGDFEERLNSILYEASSNKNVILFFDEMHMIMDAGTSNSESSMNAANILKPAISKGDVKIIGATTIKEYKKFIEKDGAFERRIQSVLVNEPSTTDCIGMLKNVVPVYSDYHNCVIDDESIESAVYLSDRYITNRKLPDKAISLLDETAARLKAHREVENDKVYISSNEIKITVSRITGIDVTDIDNTSRNKLKELNNNLKKVIIGQDIAVESVVKAIRRSKAGIKDPNRPIGSFLFVGPTGVGKTELAKAVTVELTGDIKNLIRFDMSEFMEKHNVSRLIGSPPGYVGFGDGGQLTESVRRNPYSVVLFDEIEKAHPDVFNIMLQILDDGILTDSSGIKVDFKNTIIVMTSNAGNSIEEMKVIKSIGFSAEENCVSKDNEKKTMKALENTFRPEFLNRVDKVVIFNELSENSCKDIISISLSKVAKRLKNNSIYIEWDESLVDHILKNGYSEKFGARNLNRAVQEIVEDAIADKIIDDEIKSGDSVKISFDTELIIKNNKSKYKEKKKIFEYMT